MEFHSGRLPGPWRLSFTNFLRRICSQRSVERSLTHDLTNDAEIRRGKAKIASPILVRERTRDHVVDVTVVVAVVVVAVTVFPFNDDALPPKDGHFPVFRFAVIIIVIVAIFSTIIFFVVVVIFVLDVIIIHKLILKEEIPFPISANQLPQ